MADRLARAEVGQLTQAPPQLIRLADVDDRAVGDPVGLQCLMRNGRVLPLEPPGRVGLEELWRPFARPQDHVDAASARQVLRAYLLEGDPSHEAVAPQRPGGEPGLLIQWL